MSRPITRSPRGSLARTLVPIRAMARHGAKAIWWILTPHWIPARIRLLRARTQPQGDTKQKNPEALPEELAAFVLSESQLDESLSRIQGGWQETEIRSNTPSPLRVGILTAEVRDFTLSITGWVIHEQYPNLPVRLALELRSSSDPLIVFTAHRPTGNSSRGFPDFALYFSISHEIPERLLGQDIRLRSLDHDVAFEDLPIDWSGRRTNQSHETAPSDVAERPHVKDLIVGEVEKRNRKAVRGWAFNKSNPMSGAVELVLTVDGIPYARTKATNLREEGKQSEGGDGSVGFEFPLAPNVLAGGSIRTNVGPTIGKPSILHSEGTIRPPGHHIGATLPAQSNLFDVSPTLPRGQKISVVILNRNGAEVLEDLLESARKTGELQQFEWVIVDHQSTDRSSEICTRAKESGAKLNFFDRKGNFSFSESNNFGAQKATGDIIVFANNDLIFKSPIQERILDALQDERIGLIGAKLLDYVEAPGWESRLPVQHLGVFIKPVMESGYLRPYESRMTRETPILPGARQSRPAVTAAFIALRRSDFEAVGGFEEAYSYGLEDVDLCFKIEKQLQKEVLCDLGLEIVHRHGHSRSKDDSAAVRRLRNNDHFNRTWAQWLRRNIRCDMLSRPGFWTGARPTIGFIVTNTSDSNDFQAALELGRALQAIAPVHLRYIGEDDWSSVVGIDMLVVMASRFDLTKVTNINPYVTSVNWVRHWHDHWVEAPSFHTYDHVWTSSECSAQFLQEHTGRRAAVLPLASNTALFSNGRPRPEYACDYCFVGSNYDVARSIQFDLDPPMIKGRGLVFGAGWDNTPLQSISTEPVGYEKLPDVYASTKIVIDDADFSTKSWGGCTSRLFDALAAGSLIVTNAAVGARELFGDLVPTYHDRQSLADTINYWLSYDEERKQRVAELRRLVQDRHTYEHRARHVIDLLVNATVATRVAIKCPAPLAEGKDWGDFHFAQSLAAALRRAGCVVRVDMRDDWECALSDTDDVVIMLRGLKSLKPKAHQKNILWLMSHPDDVSTAELNRYDHVYVASSVHAEALRQQCKVPIEHLPQCTDVTRFKFDPQLISKSNDRVVFVGNARGTFRDSVRWAIEHGLNIHIYGSNWEPFITDDRLKGTKVPNSVLGEFYASSRMVLCDHWEDMRRLGYISNRVFDVLAVGGTLAVDPVEGLADLLPGGSYKVFRDGDELASLVNNPDDIDLEHRAALAAWVSANHSFDARASTILTKLNEWGL